MSISGGNIWNIRHPAPTGYPAGYPDLVFQVRIYPVSGSGKKSVSGKTLFCEYIIKSKSTKMLKIHTLCHMLRHY